MKRVRYDNRPDDFEADVMQSLVEDLDETIQVYGVYEPMPVKTDKVSVIKVCANVLPMGSFGDGRLRLIDILNNGMPASVWRFPQWFRDDLKTALPVPHYSNRERFNLFFVLCWNGMSPDRAATAVWATSVDLYRINGKKVLKAVCDGYDQAGHTHHDQCIRDWLSGKMIQTASEQPSHVWQADKDAPLILCKGKQVYDLAHHTVVNVGQPPFLDYDEALHVFYMARMGIRTSIPDDETVRSSFTRFICHPDFAKEVNFARCARDWPAALELAGDLAAEIIHSVDLTMTSDELMLARPGVPVDTPNRLKVLAELNHRAKLLRAQELSARDLRALSEDDLVSFFETGAALPRAALPMPAVMFELPLPEPISAERTPIKIEQFE